MGTLNVPIYDGGVAASQVRQAKEDSRAGAHPSSTACAARPRPRPSRPGSTHEGAEVSLAAAQSEVRAAPVALDGVQKEAQAGKRTTLDVLNSQQDLMQARARLISAQQDRVVASYTLLSALGRLDRSTSRSTRRTTIRRRITSRCATPGTGCARRPGSSVCATIRAVETRMDIHAESMKMTFTRLVVVLALTASFSPVFAQQSITRAPSLELTELESPVAFDLASISGNLKENYFRSGRELVWLLKGRPRDRAFKLTKILFSAFSAAK